MDKEKIDELYNMIPDRIKKEALLYGIVEGDELIAYRQEIVFTNKGIRASAGFNSRAAKLLNIEEDLEAYANETRESFEKLSKRLKKKFIEFGECIDCAVVEKDESGKSKWPDKPTSFEINLERGKEE